MQERFDSSAGPWTFSTSDTAAVPLPACDETGLSRHTLHGSQKQKYPDVDTVKVGSNDRTVGVVKAHEVDIR